MVDNFNIEPVHFVKRLMSTSLKYYKEVDINLFKHKFCRKMKIMSTGSLIPHRIALKQVCKR